MKTGFSVHTRKLLVLRFVLIFLGLVFFLEPATLVHAATTWTVTSAADGPSNPANCPSASNCRLRDAIAAASSGDTIQFGVTGTIDLSANGELSIYKNLTINGPGALSLTISGNNATRVIVVASGFTVNLSNVTIANGYNASWFGGGIANAGTMIISNSTLVYNVALHGGAILNDGTLTLTSTDVLNNSSSYGNGRGGGAIYNETGTINIIDSTISGNHADGGGDGGAIVNWIGGCGFVNVISTYPMKSVYKKQRFCG